MLVLFLRAKRSKTRVKCSEEGMDPKFGWSSRVGSMVTPLGSWELSFLIVVDDDAEHPEPILGLFSGYRIRDSDRILIYVHWKLPRWFNCDFQPISEFHRISKFKLFHCFELIIMLINLTVIVDHAALLIYALTTIVFAGVDPPFFLLR